jgi:hypothetical protein
MKFFNRLIALITVASAQAQQITNSNILIPSTTDSTNTPIYTGDLLYDGSKITPSAKLSYVFTSVAFSLVGNYLI